MKLENFLENLWTTSPPLKTSKHPQREGGLYGRGYRGVPPYKGVFGKKKVMNRIPPLICIYYIN